MVIVTGSARIRADNLAEALILCLAHVDRSRSEAGCLAHAVHQDAQDSTRLFFFERWADRAALARHFAVPESGRFVAALSRLAESPPELAVYEAEAVALPIPPPH